MLYGSRAVELETSFHSDSVSTGVFLTMSVRFFGLIPRLPSLSRAEFHDHYRHPHGTHGLHNPGIQSYVQSHRIDTDFLGDEQRRYDAIAEVVFGSVEDGLGLATADNYLTHLNDAPWV